MNLMGTTNSKLWNMYYYVIFLCYFLGIFYTNIPVGQLATVYMIILIMDLIRRDFIIQRYFDILILAYVFYSIVTLLWYPIGRIPIQAYLVEIAYGIIPIIFYFYGKNDKKSSLLPHFFRAVFVSLVIGIVFYTWAPEFYGRYLVNIGFAANYLPPWIRNSLYSIYGATIASSFATMLTIYGFMGVCKKGSKKEWLYFLVGLIAVFLGTRRSAMAGTFLIISILHFFLYIKWRYLKVTHFIYELIVVAVLMTGGVLLFPHQVEIFLYRILMFSTAISSRSDQWILGLEIERNPVIGLGLGTVSHTAGALGFPAVHDGSLMRMYVEIGVIGVCIFTAIVLLAVLKAGFRAKEKYMEICIIAIMLIQAIGSNVLVFQLLAPIFWYSIGRCVCKPINSKKSKP